MDRHKRNKAHPVPSPESLTASTESESFETWTLVTEGAKKRRPNKTALEGEKPSDDEDRLELIEKDENNKRDNENIDDLSDGISIISDNESAGRISPHHFMEHSMVEKNFPLISEISSTTFEIPRKDVRSNQLTPPSTPREIEVSTKITGQQLDTVNDTEQEQPNSEQSSVSFFGLGVKGLFILSIIIALAAFFGKINYPELDQLSLAAQISPLAQRIDDIELQNNLLRAEIALLNKQVNYLIQLKDKTMYRGEWKGSYKQEVNQRDSKNRHPPKVWPGAGDLDVEESVDVVGFDYEEIEQPLQPPKRSGLHKEIPDVKISKEYAEKRPVREEMKYERERNPKYENHQKYPESKHPSGDSKYDSTRYQKNDNENIPEHEDRRRDKSREYHTKERFQRDEYDKVQKQDNRKDGKHEHDWHEKMMQQREDTRKNHEKRNTNNWYIERGNGREEARIVEKKDYEYRKDERKAL